MVVGGITVVVNSSDSFPMMSGTIDGLGRFNMRCRIRMVDTRHAPSTTVGFSTRTGGGNFNMVVTTTNVTTRLTNILTTGAALPIVKVPYGSTRLSNVSTLLTAIVVPAKVPITAMTISNTTGTTVLTIRVLTLSSSSLTRGLRGVGTSVRGNITRGSGTVRTGITRL